MIESISTYILIIYLLLQMDDDLKKNLLQNKTVTFQKLYEECLVRIQKIKQKNDFLQKQIGSDIQQSIKQQVKRQKQFLQKQITEIKLIMDQIDQRFRDPQSKNKLKTVKAEAQKQIQRNKVIMKDLITRSFLAHSKGTSDPNDDQQKYIEGGKIHYDEINQPHKQSIITQKDQTGLFEQQVDLDYQIERKILTQKKQLINEVEQSTLRINAIVTDMAGMVDQQGQNLDVISEQLLKTQKNVEQTNEQIQQASTMQKKSKRKYIVFALLIILLIGIVIGVVFLINYKKE